MAVTLGHWFQIHGSLLDNIVLLLGFLAVGSFAAALGYEAGYERGKADAGRQVEVDISFRPV